MSLDTLKPKVGKLIELAKSAGGDNPLQYATFQDGYLFRSSIFPENYKMEFSFVALNSANLQRCFLGSANLTEITIITENGFSAYSLFQDCKELKIVTFKNGTELRNSWSSAFNGCIALETINGELDFSNVTNIGYIFRYCDRLKDIAIKPNSVSLSLAIPSLVLSAESIQSIIDGLATVETAQTLTLHANLKILQSQVDSANAKGWTVAGGTVVSEEEYYG